MIRRRVRTALAALVDGFETIAVSGGGVSI
jgi:hypothetical protein